MESIKSLIDAARKGDIEVLNKLLQENPSLLDDVAYRSHPESALCVAIKAGHVRFVVELMKHNKKLAREFDGGGFRPLDVAAIMGNVEMVKQMLRLDPGLCLLKGNGQRTALHYAASGGKVEVIDELVTTCPECLQEVTFLQETALPLALKSYQFEAFKVLVKYLEIHKLQRIINWPDFNGNTVLHLAASTRQHEAGVTPPSGILGKSNQTNSDQNQAGSPLSPLSPPPGASIGNPAAVSGLSVVSAIFGSHATSHLFLFSNSLGLTASLSIIIYLAGGFPFQKELLMSIFAMMSSCLLMAFQQVVFSKNRKRKKRCGAAISF